MKHVSLAVVARTDESMCLSNKVPLPFGRVDTAHLRKCHSACVSSATCCCRALASATDSIQSACAHWGVAILQLDSSASEQRAQCISFVWLYFSAHVTFCIATRVNNATAVHLFPVCSK